MRIRDWLRPPRQMLSVFFAVALVSAGALGWLGWLLLQQDAALETQRRRDALEQSADRASATMQLAVAELQTAIGTPGGANGLLPSGVSRISIGQDAIAVWPDGSLPYYPIVHAHRATPPVFDEGERAEFARNDLTEAARAYHRLAAAPDPDIRGGALARLARVERKQHDVDGALQTYTQLAALEQADVDGLPAALVARSGRASVFEESGRQAALREEAAALQRDLGRGRWKLAKPQYEFYANQGSAWLGTPRVEDRAALTMAEAAEWLWQNRAPAGAAMRRAMALPNGPALLVSRTTPVGVEAIVAGPAFIAALCTRSVPADLGCGLSDPEGRALVGDRPAGRDTAVRAASASGLPWTLHVFAPPEAAAASASPRRRLLTLAFMVVASVLAAGWYFILRAMSRELRVSQLQSEFVAAVSHEFRSPLTSMAHIADLLATDRFVSDDQRRKSYAVLQRDTDRLKRLVEGLLDFGRFEAGAAALRLEDLDVAALVRTTVSDFQERVAADGYAVELSGAGEALPACVDREAIARALWNLLDNAVKYSPECRTVWVVLEYRDDAVSIVVRDQGLGIPMQEQREIFERFVRGAESTTRRIKGTGIGLAMVRQIVRAHGGEVRVASEPGKGSTFTLALRVHG